jgi:hypothetical protein
MSAAMIRNCLIAALVLGLVAGLMKAGADAVERYRSDVTLHARTQ